MSKTKTKSGNHERLLGSLTSALSGGDIQEEEKKSKAEEQRKGTRKIAVTLYPEDEKRAEAIIDYAWKHGRRIGRSMAVQLALRHVTLDKDLIFAIDDIEDEDTRRKHN